MKTGEMHITQGNNRQGTEKSATDRYRLIIAFNNWIDNLTTQKRSTPAVRGIWHDMQRLCLDIFMACKQL